MGSKVVTKQLNSKSKLKYFDAAGPALNDACPVPEVHIVPPAQPRRGRGVGRSGRGRIGRGRGGKVSRPAIRRVENNYSKFNSKFNFFQRVRNFNIGYSL